MELVHTKEITECESTITVLESFLPVYFKGATTTFKDIIAAGEINRNPVKPKVREDIKEMFAKNLSLEFSFYDFCKQRLYKQLLVLIEK